MEIILLILLYVMLGALTMCVYGAAHSSEFPYSDKADINESDKMLLMAVFWPVAIAIWLVKAILWMLKHIYGAIARQTKISLDYIKTNIKYEK